MMRQSVSEPVIKFRIDKLNLERKIKLIQNSLQPLINQILTPNPKFSSNISKGKSRNAQILVKFLIDSVENFVKKARDLSNDYPDVKDDLNLEINNVRAISQRLIDASNDFTNNPTVSDKRIKMGNTAREVLNAVARVLAIADMIDTFMIARVAETLKTIAHTMRVARSESEYVHNFQNYTQCLKELMNLTSNPDVSDLQVKHELMSSRAILLKQTDSMFTSSIALLKHPKSESAKKLHDQIYREAIAAIDAIKNMFSNQDTSNSQDANSNKTRASLLDSMNELDRQITEMNTLKYTETTYRVTIERQVDTFIETILTLSSQYELNDLTKKSTIAEECAKLRQALQDLWSSYGEYNRNGDNTLTIDKNKVDFIKKSKSIRRQICKSILVEFSLENFKPLDALYDAARSGNQRELNECIPRFEVYANKLIQLGLLATSLKNTNPDGIKLAEMAAAKLKSLVPLIINSARVLCEFPDSNEAQKNMELFRSSWVGQVKLFTLALDDLTSINDFLSVNENLILKDINKCITAVSELNPVDLNHHAELVKQRTIRICDAIYSEMNNYEPCDFVNKVNGTVVILRNQIIKNFSRSVTCATEAMMAKPMREPDENDFYEASHLIYDSIRDLRNALLSIPQEDPDDVSEVDEAEYGDKEYDRDEDFYDSEDEDESYLNITREQKREINEQFGSLVQEKRSFDREVLRWDDKSNDIVVLAKEMSVIMMDMTNFTRGKGPYKTMSDILNAGKRISEIGTRLEKLCRDLAKECPESSSKRDLLDSLNLLPLFCKQLNIGVKVKENVIDPDSASSVLISSKNLMNAVIKVVKLSYVASTKYTSKTSDKKPIVQWKMKPPELKPLVPKPRSHNLAPNLVRKDSNKNKYFPVKALMEFEI